MLSVLAIVISGFGILILNAENRSKIDSLAENLLKARCLLTLLDAAHWNQGVLCLHQVVLGGGRESELTIDTFL